MLLKDWHSTCLGNQHLFLARNSEVQPTILAHVMASMLKNPHIHPQLAATSIQLATTSETLCLIILLSSVCTARQEFDSKALAHYFGKAVLCHDGQKFEHYYYIVEDYYI